jgi:hypothetical protein
VASGSPDRATAPTPPAAPVLAPVELVEARGGVYPVARVQGSVAYRHGERLFRCVPVSGVDVGVGWWPRFAVECCAEGAVLSGVAGVAS